MVGEWLVCYRIFLPFFVCIPLGQFCNKCQHYDLWFIHNLEEFCAEVEARAAGSYLNVSRILYCIADIYHWAHTSRDWTKVCNASYCLRTKGKLLILARLCFPLSEWMLFHHDTAMLGMKPFWNSNNFSLKGVTTIWHSIWLQKYTTKQIQTCVKIE